MECTGIGCPLTITSNRTHINTPMLDTPARYGQTKTTFLLSYSLVLLPTIGRTPATSPTFTSLPLDVRATRTGDAASRDPRPRALADGAGQGALAQRPF